MAGKNSRVFSADRYQRNDDTEDLLQFLMLNDVARNVQQLAHILRCMSFVPAVQHSQLTTKGHNSAINFRLSAFMAV